MIPKSAVLLVLLFAAGLSMASQDKKEAKKIDYSTVIGTFESYKKEVLTLKVDNKKKEFKVPGDTDVGYASGKDKTKVEKAKEHLKDVKKGSFVSVTLDGDGKKVLGVGVSVPELPGGKPESEEKREIKSDGLQTPRREGLRQLWER